MIRPRFRHRWTLLAIVFLCVACSKEKLPNYVQRAGGYAYIPMADKAFLIPEKTWLKSYGRSASDGEVRHISLHAKTPEVEPWRQEIHSKMYPYAARGDLLEVQMRSFEDMDIPDIWFQYPPTYAGEVLIPDDDTLPQYPGLRKYVRPTPDPLLDIYVHIKDQRVVYLLNCVESPGVYQLCRLRFPWNKKIEVELVFDRTIRSHGVEMADRIVSKLKEFEAAGESYAKALKKTRGSSRINQR